MHEGPEHLSCFFCKRFGRLRLFRFAEAEFLSNHQLCLEFQKGAPSYPNELPIFTFRYPAIAFRDIAGYLYRGAAKLRSEAI